MELSGAEIVFAKRMLPHFLAGKTVEAAARAVLEDDARLFTAFCNRSHSYFVDSGDGRSGSTRVAEGDVIAKELTGAVYRQLTATT